MAFIHQLTYFWKKTLLIVIVNHQQCDQDLTKFCHFGKVLSFLAIFGMAYLVFGKLLYRLWYFHDTGQIVIVVNNQRLFSNIAIWSH